MFVYFINGLCGNGMCLFAVASLQNSFKGNLLIPPIYSPIDGNLLLQLHHHNPSMVTTTTNGIPSNTTMRDIRLQISRFEGLNKVSKGFIDVYPDPRSNTTQITVPCQRFLLGGLYELEILDNITLSGTTVDERLRQQLTVQWPTPKLSVTPNIIGTYPQQPVDVILEFPGVECIGSHLKNDVPEFWVELYYCGHDVNCHMANVSASVILFKEQVRGYPKAHLIKLSCDLFGLAGTYVVKLRPIAPVAAEITTSAYINVSLNV